MGKRDIEDLYTNAKRRWKRARKFDHAQYFVTNIHLDKSTNQKGVGAITGTVPTGKSPVRSDRRASAQNGSGKE